MNKKKKVKAKYYLVSYNFSNEGRYGFGNIFFSATPSLDIRAAEKEISETAGLSKVIILFFVEVDESQYVPAPKKNLEKRNKK